MDLQRGVSDPTSEGDSRPAAGASERHSRVTRPGRRPALQGDALSAPIFDVRTTPDQPQEQANDIPGRRAVGDCHAVRTGLDQ